MSEELMWACQNGDIDEIKKKIEQVQPKIFIRYTSVFNNNTRHSRFRPQTNARSRHLDLLCVPTNVLN